MSEQERGRINQAWATKLEPWVKAYAQVYFGLFCISAAILVIGFFVDGVTGAEFGLSSLPYTVQLLYMTTVVIVGMVYVVIFIAAIAIVPIGIVGVVFNFLRDRFQSAVKEIENHE